MSTWVLRPTGVASCAFGHSWPVTLTWTPAAVPVDGQLVPIPNTWTFTSTPAWCEACFMAGRLAQPSIGVICDEDEPAPAAPSNASPDPVTVE